MLPWADQGDHVLTNVLACEPGEPAGCAPETTTNQVRHLSVAKTSDATADSRPGDDVTYTVTATNDGTGDYTAADPATLLDDLADVLDDAEFDGTATASTGSTTYAAPRLSLDRRPSGRRDRHDHLHGHPRPVAATARSTTRCAPTRHSRAPRSPSTCRS